MPPKPKPRVSKPKQGPAGSRAKPPSRRNLLLAVAGAAAVAAALIAASLVLAGGDDDSSTTPTTTTPSGLLAGIDQDDTLLGNPAATVTMIEYADLQCPICRQYTLDFFPSLVDEYVRPGSVRMEFRGLAFIGPDSEKALRFTLAAGKQDHLWDFQEALYNRQGQENSGWVTDDLLREIGSSIEGLDVDQLFADADSQEISDRIAEMERQGTEAKVEGTPWFFLKVGDADPYHIEPRSLEEFRAALDDALEG
jgi:protein-disulfide isomerase